MLLPAKILNLQQDLGKSLKTQIFDLIQNQSDLFDLFWLSIREIEAISFAHLLVKLGYRTFNLLLRDLNQFFDRSKSNTLFVSDSILTFNVFLSHYISDFYLTISKNC